MKDIILDPDTPTEGWPGQVSRAHDVVVAPTPSIQEVSDHFTQAQIDTKKMDEFDRDVMWRRAREWSDADVAKRYPDVDSSKLKELARLAKGWTP